MKVTKSRIKVGGKTPDEPFKKRFRRKQRSEFFSFYLYGVRGRLYGHIALDTGWNDQEHLCKLFNGKSRSPKTPRGLHDLIWRTMKAMQEHTDMTPPSKRKPREFGIQRKL